MQIRPIENPIFICVTLLIIAVTLSRCLYVSHIDRSYFDGMEYQGRVTDVEGEGVSGVEILVIESSGDCQRIQTKLDGSFTFLHAEDWKYIVAAKEAMEFMYVDRYSPGQQNTRQSFAGWESGQFSSTRVHEVGKVYSIQEASQIFLDENFALRFSGIGSENVDITIDGADIAFVESRELPIVVPEIYYEKIVVDTEKLAAINSIVFKANEVVGWVTFGVRKKGGVLVFEWGESRSPVEYLLYPSHAYKNLYNEIVINGKSAFDRYHQLSEVNCF